MTIYYQLEEVNLAEIFELTVFILVTLFLFEILLPAELEECV